MAPSIVRVYMYVFFKFPSCLFKQLGLRKFIYVGSQLEEIYE